MKLLTAALASLALIGLSQAQETKVMPNSKLMLSSEEIGMVAPALDKYTQGRLLGDVWKRPGLGPRDRSIVTLAALIARNQTIEMTGYMTLALDHGVKPAEIFGNHHAPRFLLRLAKCHGGGCRCERCVHGEEDRDRPTSCGVTIAAAA